MQKDYKKVKVTNKGENSILNGHPWVFVQEIINKDLDINNGDIVTVINEKDKFLGFGFYNDNSKILVRIISTNSNDVINYEFFKRRVTYAFNFRKEIMDNLNNFRLIFGEADEMPGVTIDIYNNICVSQILCLGMDIRKDMIYKAVREVLKENDIKIIGIYERFDVNIRSLEGLDMYKNWYDYGDEIPSSTKASIVENDIKYIVDFENGQKTGFFLDQKYNRLLVRKLASNKTVLDCCTHTGSFAMNAYLGGAKKVTALDISDEAIKETKENFKLNNMDIDTIIGDCFDVLKEKGLNHEKYDFVVLDPPAFTKSRKTITNALRGYQEVNYLAMKITKRGGYFATATCSHFASSEEFVKALKKAAVMAGFKLKLVSFTGPSFDHPEVLSIPETKYLKFFIFQLI